jgi:hypothetical protein
MPTPTHTKEIVYNRESQDFTLLLNGELVGFARTYSDGERALDDLVYDLLNQPAQAIAQAEAVLDSVEDGSVLAASAVLNALHRAADADASAICDECKQPATHAVVVADEDGEAMQIDLCDACWQPWRTPGEVDADAQADSDALADDAAPWRSLADVHTEYVQAKRQQPTSDPWDDGPEPEPADDTPMSPERAAQIDSWLKGPPPPPQPITVTTQTVQEYAVCVDGDPVAFFDDAPSAQRAATQLSDKKRPKPSKSKGIVVSHETLKKLMEHQKPILPGPRGPVKAA